MQAFIFHGDVLRGDAMVQCLLMIAVCWFNPFQIRPAVPPSDSDEVERPAIQQQEIEPSDLSGPVPDKRPLPDKRPREPVITKPRPRTPAGSLSIGFAYDPGQGKYDGAVGRPSDVWNFVDIGTTAVDYLRHADGSGSSARLRVSKSDGEWAVKTDNQIFRGYIYRNCQCVDLEVSVLDLQPGRYQALVYAHGDAANQNASIEMQVGEENYGRRATSKAADADFRSRALVEGVHYVSFEILVSAGEDVRITSHRDGSGYSMFNAIQFVPIPEPTQRARIEPLPPQDPEQQVPNVLRSFFTGLSKQDAESVNQAVASKLMIVRTSDEDAKATTPKDALLTKPPKATQSWAIAAVDGIEVRSSALPKSIANVTFDLKLIGGPPEEAIDFKTRSFNRLRPLITCEASAVMVWQDGHWKIQLLTLPR